MALNDKVRTAKVQAAKAKDQATKAVADNEGKIGSAIDRAGRFVDDTTKGRYRSKIDKAAGNAKRGVGKVAGQAKGGGAAQPGSGPEGGPTTEQDSTPDEEQGSGTTP